jgi:ATP-binding cassette, subfamily A (ABC1), member 3
MQIRVNHL